MVSSSWCTEGGAAIPCPQHSYSQQQEDRVVGPREGAMAGLLDWFAVGTLRAAFKRLIRGFSCRFILEYPPNPVHDGVIECGERGSRGLAEVRVRGCEQKAGETSVAVLWKSAKCQADRDAPSSFSASRNHS
jgi:hypothetical protein